jgi:hypothetical protein
MKKIEYLLVHRNFGVTLLALIVILAACIPSNPVQPTPQSTVYPTPTAARSTNIPNDSQAYEIGSPRLQELYISPTGSDTADGSSPAHPLRTLSAAWARIPEGTLETGVRINLLPGTYPCEPGPEESNCINYFANRHGTALAPIILSAAQGAGSVTLRGGLNLNDVAYLYLLDLNLVGGGDLPTNSSGNNLLHIEGGDHVLLRGLSVLGPACANDTCNNLQEALKVNQTQYLYVENSQIAGAWHSAVDYFVVQYGHFRNNQVHTAGQWCMYVKGGSAYLTIEGNEFHDCQLGFQSGQSANLAVMREPWVHYETYAIRFINNILHHIPGVGLSAAGAYNTLFAYNTLYKVGTSSDPGYALVQLTYGERNCTPIDEIQDVIRNCTAYTARGAWGPSAPSDSLPAIPNLRVFVYNNLFYNPAPAQTPYTHFEIPGPLAPPPGFKNIPNPILSDRGLSIAGNLIWNGPPGHPLGIEEPERGCQPANPTCNQSQIAAQNTINILEPDLIDPAHGNFRPRPGGNLSKISAAPIPTFTWDTFSPAVPLGTLHQVVLLDREGKSRGTVNLPGAYVP